MTIPAQFALPNLVVRETAKAQVNEQWGLMRGLWHWSSAAGGLSVGLAVIGLGIAWLFAERFSSLQLATFAWGLILVPLIVFGSLRSATLSGLRRVVLGQLPEQVLRPGLLFLLILGTILWLGTGEFSAANAIGLHALAAALAFLIGA